MPEKKEQDLEKKNTYSSQSEWKCGAVKQAVEGKSTDRQPAQWFIMLQYLRGLLK